MHSHEFSTLMQKYPSEKSSISAIEDLIDANRKSGGTSEYGVERLIELCRPKSMFSFQLLLSEMDGLGALRRVYRLVTENELMLKEFRSLSEIPETVVNDFTGFEQEVDPELIREIYKIEIKKTT